jgi:glucosamine--fructose-6-phosphate aminotransferase (isomerizing)
MCGIYGILLKKPDNIYDLILQGLAQLQNRGYDSAGICVYNDGLHITKYASTEVSALDLLSKTTFVDRPKIGMGHNRWATHGQKTDLNSHPHASNDGNWAIVHNGIIENYEELKELLPRTTFHSQTDTEVIVHLLQYNYEGDILATIQKTIGLLKGTYALIIMTAYEPNKLFCVRDGSPLLIGYNEERIIITSEKSGFGCSVKYSPINGICVIHDNFTLENYTEHIVDKESLTPYPYEHWTLKEIHEQVNVTSISSLDINAEHIILLGCGTSYYAGLYGMHFFKKTRNYNTVQVFDGADFTTRDIPKGSTVFILISQSGETRDLYRCIEIAKQRSIQTIGIINVEDSLIAREVDRVVYCKAGKEVGVASTKSFMSQVICLSVLAGNDTNGLSGDIQKTIQICKPICSYLAKQHTNLFLLGKGADEIIAKEGALKLKEMAYIHAEGYSSSSLKHGPFALLDEEMPVILLNFEQEHTPKIMNCYHEIVSRNSPVLFITNRENEYADIVIPYNETYASLLGIIPIQLLAYYISVSKGINPDKPKNLAKVVTVE